MEQKFNLCDESGLESFPKISSHLLIALKNRILNYPDMDFGLTLEVIQRRIA